MKRAVWLALACLVPLGTLRALDATPAPAAASRSRGPVPLRVEITLSRSDGARQIDSRSYVMWVTAHEGPVTLKTGIEVPVPVTTFHAARPDAPAGPVTSQQYRNVGVNLKCRADALEDGRYKLDLEFEQSSPGGGQADMPRFRTVHGHFKMLLRDGQTGEAAVAADPASAESLRVTAALRVLE
jgi:hypothetical protein